MFYCSKKYDLQGPNTRATQEPGVIFALGFPNFGPDNLCKSFSKNFRAKKNPG